MNEKIRVLSIDDHPRMREGIAVVINSHPHMQLVAQASTGSDAIGCFREHAPDITLMDLRLPDMSGIDAAINIRTEFPQARIIILTTFESEVDRERALAAGACAFLLKSAPAREIWQTICQVHAR